MEELLARRPEAIRRMFAAVAPRYDLLNRLLSLRRDVAWRRRLVQALGEAPPGPVLDLATGTADVALAIPGRAVVAVDFCVDMLALARKKARHRAIELPLVAADASTLPFADGTFAAVTVAFGLRNLASLETGLAETRRVLRPRGILATLEFQRPARRLVAAALATWNRLVVCPAGRGLSPHHSAYAYLPASVDTFPDSFGLLAAAVGQGFEAVRRSDLSGGIAALTISRRSERP